MEKSQAKALLFFFRRVNPRLRQLKNIITIFFFVFLFGNQSSAQKIQPAALKQIQSLLDEKESRTPAQKKMDSQLWYAIKMGRGQAISSEVATLQVDVNKDAGGRAPVDIHAQITDALVQAIINAGGEIIFKSVTFNRITARVPLQSLEQIASLQEVKSIYPVYPLLHAGAPINNTSTDKTSAPSNRIVGETPYRRVSSPEIQEFRPGFELRAEMVRKQVRKALVNKGYKPEDMPIGSVTSQGDVKHNVAIARTTFGVNGTGVKIGVISDSYNSSGAAAGNVIAGDLPGVGNPNGFTTPVTVLAESVGFDEGRAMLQIIHDLAPGAQLYFATVNGTGENAFAQHILDLRAAGCDIICDDVSYPNEPVFQDGIIAQAVNTVTAGGAIYFASAGNSGNKNDGTSGVWEGDFSDAGTNVVGTVPPFAGGTVHNFGAGITNDQLTTSGLFLSLFWSDPQGGSNNDYDLFVLNAGLTAIISSSTTVQNGTQDPIEFLGTPPAGSRIVIFKKTSAAIRALHLNTMRGELGISTTGETHGHGSAAAAFCVAATKALGPGPFTSANNNDVENFSSDGPRRKFYNPNGTPITPGNFLFGTNGGVLLQKPDITAADGVSTTVPGLLTFFGTSASAPHAAAIAALIKSKIPGITPAQIRSALTSSAIDIETPGVDRDAGAGIVMAYEALQAAIALQGIPTSSILNVSGPSIICNGSSGNLMVTITGGIPPYTVVYSNGTSNTSVTNYTSGSNIIVSPAFTTSYSLISVTDANGAAGSGNSGTATIRVNTIPSVNTISAQAVCNNTATPTINFTGPDAGTVFNWTNNNPSIGLAANGTGDIASFTAINTTNAPVTATVTVTPSSAGFAYIANFYSNTVSVINTASNSVVATIPVGSGPKGVSVNPDGSRVYVANLNSGTVSVINTATNSVVATVVVGVFPQSVSVSPDGSRVYVANNYPITSVSVINAATNLLTSSFFAGSNCSGVAVSPDGSKAYVTSTGINKVSVINTATNSVAASIDVGGSPVGITVSPDGSRVYVTNTGSHAVSVINPATVSVVATIPVGLNPAGVSVSPDGSRIYVANSNSDNISVINAATNSVVASIPLGAGVYPYGISVSADGSRVYVTKHNSNNVSIINTATNSVIATVPVEIGPDAMGNFISGIVCTGTSKTFTITVNPSPAITAATITQPSCAALTGTITVNATGAGVLEYSTDNGNNWQLSSIFSSLAPGSYTIKVRSQGSNCETNYTGNPVVLVSPVCNTKTIPGRIEAESWDVKNGPQYGIASTDAGGGQQVVGITNGSWMDYNVTVEQSGIYTVNFRVATTQNNAQFQIKLGATILGTINIPNTGGWSNWVTIPVSNIPLIAGVQTIRIQSINNETCNFNWTDWNLTSAKVIPGRIEAENFDVKNGPQYAVPSTDAGGGQQVVGITNGSWMDYNVTVLASGTYKVDFRVATTQNNAQFQIKLGATVLGTINIPNTGGWSNWQTVSVTNIPLTAGIQTIRIQLSSNESCNFNWTDWALMASTGKVIPGKIEAENFDAKSGLQYAIPSTDAGGGQQVVGLTNGSWMDYNVTVMQTGNYTVNFRVATTQLHAQFQIKSGAAVLGTMNIPNTGGWDNWQTVAVNNISLTAGAQTIRIQLSSNETCNFNWMDWVLAIPFAAPAIALNYSPDIVPAQKEIKGSELSVSVFPNPAESYFNLKVQSKNIEAVTIRITDIAGRQVQQLQAIPGQTIRFGDKMMNGTYLVEVRQGSERTVTKVVKQ